MRPEVRMILAEKQLPWHSHYFDLRAGDQHKPEYLKLNPNSVVPTLLDNGTVIIESTVICGATASNLQQDPV